MWFIKSIKNGSALIVLLILTAIFTVLNGSAVAQNNEYMTGPQTFKNFPRSYQLSIGGTMTVFEPQIASWFSQKNIVAWSAVSYEAKQGDKPLIGSIRIEATTDVAIDIRLVKFNSFVISEVNMPSISKEDAQKIAVSLQSEMPADDRVVELDRVLAAVSKSKLISDTGENQNVKTDPPTIFYSSTPAILVGFDGEPIWNPIVGVDLKYAINTNWDLFQQNGTNTFYLRKDANWLRSNDLKTGWVPAATLPESLSRLPADDNWKDVKANIPGKKIPAGQIPKVFLATSPAELIVVDGSPKYEPVASTILLWVSNTESDVFRNGQNGDFYYLVAGRWFSAPSLNGPWTFATPSLPADFQKIPIEHPRSRVLASVPGTSQATEGILQASVPRSARVNKDQVPVPQVVYQGDPVFEPIPDTNLSRAVNTDKEIVSIGDYFYMCYQAVWFISPSPTGPWTPTSQVPKEIYTIPASSPVHDVTYVTATDVDPSDEWIDYTYMPGYTGEMVAYGCAMWGTGWYYPPYVYYGGVYPIYYPYYRTFGYSAYYNPYTGTFGRGAAVYGPYGGAGFGAVYNPYTGTYARGATAYGPYGAKSFAQAYNPRTGTYAQTRQGGNVYGNWGSSYVQRGDSWAQSGHASNSLTGNSIAGIRTGSGAGVVTGSGNNGRTTVGRSQGGDIYAGHDGSVYRNTGDGWQKYENGNWTNAAGNARQNATAKQRPNSGTGMDSATLNQLNRDAAVRMDGAARTNSLNNYRSSQGGRASAGSFRGGGRRR